MYNKPVNAGALALYLLLLQTVSSPKASKTFHWDWHNWQELSWMQSLRNARMSDSDKAAIAEAIEAQLRPEMGIPEIESEEELVKAAWNTSIKAVDLDRDGVPEVVAQAMAGCGAVGNCSFWVFQKTSHGYNLLLDGYGQTFTIQPENTNGFRDIVVASHSSANDSGLAVFRYKDGSYHEAGCYDANFAPVENGVRRELKEPRVTPAACDSD